MISNLLLYILNFSLSLGLFWLVYYVFIKPVKNIIFNRYYLFLTILFSLFVPTITISTPFPDSREAIARTFLSQSNIDDIFPVSTISTTESTIMGTPIVKTVKSSLKGNNTNSNNNYGELTLIWIYFIIGSFLLFFFIYQIVKTSFVIIKSQRKKVNGFTVCVNPGVKSPYSFLQFIIINPYLYSSDEYKQIIAHESEHCKQLHFIEITLTEILKPLFWFVPFVWMYEKEIKENHEYLADYSALKWGLNKQIYQQTLLKGSLGMQYLGITSFLHKSFIKKRIIMMTNYQLRKLPVWKIVLLISVVLTGLTAFSNKPAHYESSGSIAANSFSETLQLNKVYQFISRIDGNFFCRGTYTFYSIDDNGIWHGSQSNFTQYSDLVVTAKVSNDTIEIYTGKPWNETWKVTSIKNGIFMGEMTGDYSLAQKANITFELKEHVNISELMPDYQPKSKEVIAGNVPFLKNEKYYWELWDEKTQTSSLSGWFNFKAYNTDTKTLSGVQYNYRTNSFTEFTGTYADGIITIRIGAPWNEVWTGEINNNMYVGEQTFNHNSTHFKGKGARAWRMSTKPFEDRLKVFEALNKK